MTGSTLPTLVVIDDEPDIRDFVMVVARAAGYSSSAVTDAGPWLMGEQVPPDVIILDLVMPGMDGVEVLREFARRHQSSRIIISSAHSSRVLGLSIVGQLPKPFHAAQPRELLNQQLAASKPEPAAKLNPALPELRRTEASASRSPSFSYCRGRKWRTASTRHSA